MKHPIFGDDKYGGGLNKTKGFIPEMTKLLKQLLKGIGRHALHARRISFQHPSTKKEIEIVAPVPKDLGKIIEDLPLING